MKHIVRIRVSKRRQSATGWNLIVGARTPERLWFRTKAQAVSAMFALLKDFQLSVKPAPAVKRTAPPSEWLVIPARREGL